MAPGFGLHLDGSENIAFLFRTYMSAQEARLPVPASHFLDNVFISSLVKIRFQIFTCESKNLLLPIDEPERGKDILNPLVALN